MAVSTPCIGVCVMDPASDLCLGCGRTLAEIAAWGTLVESERLAVMANLPERQARLRHASADRPSGARRA